jgi:DNA topoisomerase-6 subunit B
MPDKKEDIIANELAKKQKEISISEFFEKNKHLLGFDNPKKALLTTIKEAVDNSLDACQDMKVLPEIKVEIEFLGNDRFKVSIEDNGPGIIKQQIPNIFAKLLYGSKFHAMRQQRGQQGIGISAAVLYSQLTTGKPAKIISKISPRRPAHYYELNIDTRKNEPDIIKDEEIQWNKDSGVKIELELEAQYQKGKRSIDEYLKQTAIVNPHLNLIYINPEKEKVEYPRVTKDLPKDPKEIKPHPYGIEIGILIRMLKSTNARTLQAFLIQDFSRISSKTAKEIIEKSNLQPNIKPHSLTRQDAEHIMNAIKETKIMAPPTDCLSPIGEDLILKGLKKEINADFYASVTRSPGVYRGMPFQVEVGIAYGGNIPSDELVEVLRFANRVPLLYEQSACAITKSIINTAWRNYGLQQSRSALPQGPCNILIHICSVWVPYTSESKEAIASYPEIVKEIKLALQECGRKLSLFIRRRKIAEHEAQKKSYIEKYLPHVGIALKELLDLNNLEQNKVTGILKEVLEKGRER